MVRELGVPWPFTDFETRGFWGRGGKLITEVGPARPPLRARVCSGAEAVHVQQPWLKSLQGRMHALAAPPAPSPALSRAHPPSPSPSRPPSSPSCPACPPCWASLCTPRRCSASERGRWGAASPQAAAGARHQPGPGTSNACPGPGLTAACCHSCLPLVQRAAAAGPRHHRALALHCNRPELHPRQLRTVRVAAAAAQGSCCAAGNAQGSGQAPGRPHPMARRAAAPTHPLRTARCFYMRRPVQVRLHECPGHVPPVGHHQECIRGAAPLVCAIS